MTDSSTDARDLKPLFLDAKLHPEKQTAFFTNLLEGDLFTLDMAPEAEGGVPVGDERRHSGNGSDRLQLLILNGPMGHFTPMWYSLADLQIGLSRLGLPAGSYVRMKTAHMLEMIPDRRIVLNPATDLQWVVEPEMLQYLLDLAAKSTVSAPQPNVSTQSADMFAVIPTAIAAATAFIEGRSDISWQVLDDAFDEGNGIPVAKALVLLLTTLVENHAIELDVDPLQVLQRGALSWEKSRDIGDGETVASTEVIKQLTVAPCVCGHLAYEHGRAAWLFREFGSQTKSACDATSCECSRFASVK